ncbi:hypothetical protein [Micromonospora wenchangensis]|uniref:hypothetical protein n=1 Tax=Micromonospora wenchangensis TaxID=1185415 RepID=UPI003829F961
MAAAPTPGPPARSYAPGGHLDEVNGRPRTASYDGSGGLSGASPGADGAGI